LSERKKLSDLARSLQIFDINSRAILRSISEHKQYVFSASLSLLALKNTRVIVSPVHAARFSPSPSSSILTASDDTTVRLWDLATAENTAYFDSHSDYVRAAAFVPSDPRLVLSGSYDTTVKLWDSRQSENGGEARTLDHGYPVESLIVHPSGTMAVSAGGPMIRVWDLLSGSPRCLKALSNHQKTVTCLAWDGERKRLLSGGLDGLVKVYQIDAGQWRVGHTMRYGGQILSLAVSVRCFLRLQFRTVAD
jgi:U3 small nucleolar RNA-associated protein 15